MFDSAQKDSIKRMMREYLNEIYDDDPATRILILWGVLEVLNGKARTVTESIPGHSLGREHKHLMKTIQDKLEAIMEAYWRNKK